MTEAVLGLFFRVIRGFCFGIGIRRPGLNALRPGWPGAPFSINHFRMLSRREFGAALVSAAGLSCLAGPTALFAAQAAGTELTPDRRRSLQAALAKEDASYDPAERMLRSAGTGGPGYHTTIKSGFVHSTRSSLTYAAALLDSGEPARLARAQDILRAVLALQDPNPPSKTYGIWPWYLEEPLDKMSPPDWNWADFCGVQLLAAWIGHRNRLGAELAEQVRGSIGHAARSIQRRNVGPGYTNIAIMGTYVTLVAAQEMGLGDLRDYTQKRLRHLHATIMAQGSFAEYNSPTYSVVALTELSRMLLHVRDNDDRRLIQELHDLAWSHVATHFHAPTRQWAGPHSRSYSDDLRQRPGTLAFLEAATGRKAHLIDADPLPLGLDAYRLPLECPRRLAPLFRELSAPRQVLETFIPAEPSRAGSKRPVVGTTWLHPQFALGSVSRGDFWNQRRPLLAYWGTPEKPVWLRARFLHDQYDFCSALLFSAQHEGCALSTMVFATDYGDTHPNLDRVKNGAIKAKDLRLRFELGGELRDASITLPPDAAEPVRILDRGVEVRLHRVGDSFGGQPVLWQTGQEKETRFIDAVVYAGAEKSFELRSWREAFVAFGLHFAPANGSGSISPPRLTKTDGWVKTEWRAGTKLLSVTAPMQPGSLAGQNDAVVTGVD